MVEQLIFSHPPSLPTAWKSAHSVVIEFLDTTGPEHPSRRSILLIEDWGGFEASRFDEEVLI